MYIMHCTEIVPDVSSRKEDKQLFLCIICNLLSFRNVYHVIHQKTFPDISSFSDDVNLKDLLRYIFFFLTITWTLTMVYKKDVDILMILMFMVHLTDPYRLVVGTVYTKLYRAILSVPTHCTWGIPIYRPYRSPVRSIHVAHTERYATVR